MLHALEDFDQSLARKALAAAAGRLLPMPGEFEFDSGTNAAADRIIEEVRTRARASHPRSEDEQTRRIIDILSQALSEAILAGADITKVRHDVGARGILPPALYRVLYSPKFNLLAKHYMMQKSFVEAAIHRCDMVQHFTTLIEGPKAPPSVSLFTQTVVTNSPYRYTTLVRATRDGDVLTVDDAFRVYHDEIELFGATTPLEILKRFLDRYGLEIEVTTGESSERAKLIHDKVYEVPVGQTLALLAAGSVQKFTHAVGEDNRLEFSLSYSVNNTDYVAALRRHGVQATVPSESVTATAFRSAMPPQSGR